MNGTMKTMCKGWFGGFVAAAVLVAGIGAARSAKADTAYAQTTSTVEARSGSATEVMELAKILPVSAIGTVTLFSVIPHVEVPVAE